VSLQVVNDAGGKCQQYGPRGHAFVGVLTSECVQGEHAVKKNIRAQEMIGSLAVIALMLIGVNSAMLAQSPTVAFKDAKLREQIGDKTKDSDAVLMYNDAALMIHAGDSSLKKPHILKTIAYSDTTGAEYTFGKSPRVSAALLVSPLFLFNSSKSHWLTVHTGTDYAVLRLDKSNYKLVLAEFEKRTGKKVESVGENK